LAKELITTENATFKAKILVMNDDEMVRGIAREMLAHLGHEMFLAADGDEAIRLFENTYKTEEEIDLVIMDLT